MSDGDECYGKKIKAEKGTRGGRWLGAILTSETREILIFDGEKSCCSMGIFQR